MTSKDEAWLESLRRQQEVGEWIRGGWLLDSRRLRNAALAEYRCRHKDLLAALVKVEGTFYFMWRQHRAIAVVDSDDLQDWSAGAVPDGVNVDAAARAIATVDRWLDEPCTRPEHGEPPVPRRRWLDEGKVPAPGYRPESLRESAQLTPEPVQGGWECERFADWPDGHRIHANCEHHTGWTVTKQQVKDDARRLRRARSKRVTLSL
ncbi:hypothetical protein BJF89_16190 [Corynebacterium sp. CNJ-954]|nr:hypothetical protein BJF89_16190 [Corynebacterium sp. CNJ-954]